MSKLKNTFLLLSFCLLGTSSFAQKDNKELRISLQTDVLAYTTPYGWSLWSVARYGQNKLALGFINYPNRYGDIYNETGIKNTDLFLRLQLSRHFKPTSKLKNFFYGIDLEHHWRKLEEDNNPNEILNDTHWRLGAFVGYDWYPWSKQENALQNLSLTPWVGFTVNTRANSQVRVFENTGNIYPISNLLDMILGINIGYTIFKK